MRFLYLFICSLLTANSYAAIYDVSTTSELRAALVSAGETGGENTIRLAAGTYSTQDDGGGAFRYVTTKNGSLLLVGNSQSNTLLDGGGQNRVFVTVVEDSVAVSLALSNFTVRNGKAPDGFNGGGINLDPQTSSLSLESMTFLNNTGYVGGALGDYSGASLVIKNSQFINNSATVGGAICASTWILEDSLFEGNTASSNGGALKACGLGDKITINNTFNGNSAGRSGVIEGPCNGQHVTAGNTFSNNYASQEKGIGIMCGEWTRNLMSDNSAQDRAIGDILGTNRRFNSNILINNVSINQSTNYARSAIGSGNGVVNNNIFFNTTVGLGSAASLANNVFLSNEDDLIIFNVDDFYRISNNYIDVAKLPSTIILVGSNNIFEGVNLGFVNAEEGDYRLTSSSGLIDAGTTDPELAYITDYDYTGTTARIIGSSVDIGPYEYDGEAPPDSDGDGLNDNIDNCPSIANADQADFDSDGEGDICDLDDDNDGIADTDDAFPLDASESLDTDGDGIGNNEDYDDDGDGFIDASDPQPTIANVFAIDSDGDGVADSFDDYPADASRQFAKDGDIDGDGYTNDEEVDYCSNPLDATSQPRVQGLSPALIKSAIDANSGG